MVRVHARLVCSEEECTDTFEAYGPLDELEKLACDCGCALEVLGWPDTLDDDGDDAAVVLLAA